MKIYARQIAPEYQESPLFYEDMFPDNMIVSGNRHYKEHTTPTFDQINRYFDEMAGAWEDANFYYQYSGNGKYTKIKKKPDCTIAELLRDYGFSLSQSSFINLPFLRVHSASASVAHVSAGRVGDYQIPSVYVVSLAVFGLEDQVSTEQLQSVTFDVPLRVSTGTLLNITGVGFTTAPAKLYTNGLTFLTGNENFHDAPPYSINRQPAFR